MGNPFGSFVNGVGHLFGNIFGAPIDFLSGKSCNSRCGPTWDLECYVENFCIQHLLKLFFVSLLLYVVLSVFYLLYKLKVFHCLFKGCVKMIWSCISNVCLFWDNVFRILFGMVYTLHERLHNIHERRKQYKRDLEMANMNRKRYEEEEEEEDEDEEEEDEEEDDEDEDEDEDEEASVSYHKERYRQRRKLWSGDHKSNLLRRSLKARNHRVHVGVDSDRVTKRKHIKHDDVRVVRTSSFAKKGLNHKRYKHKRKKTS